jgi:hypothetical protein
VRALLAQRKVTQFVHDQDVWCVVVMEFFQQRVIRLGRNALIAHVHGRGQEHLEIGVTYGIRQACGQEGFARPRVANENDIAMGRDEVEVQQLQEAGFLLLSGWVVVEVELINGAFVS